ncbi:PAS domain-containing protein [Massilia sp. Mn16-1_5]|uniref:PAS domain-containing protein n=1 Tax=Massilia sp. Mn16-1_5 TaxID=2079199 RepID=UPI00109E6BE6|nr:PAS domain-containing protein [Massilia sp. Mn16-1_5]THC44588.1 hybrid sensor histidine kinase/response regulator [Massilia sp. Mn16-1_5]
METPSDPMAQPALDFKALFDAIPSPCLVLSPELRIVSVNQAYLNATSTRPEDLLGRGMFDAFPDNPDDASASGVANLRASLQRVLHTACADTMAIQKYDIRIATEGNQFEERFWSPVNTPVLNADGVVTHIIHRVEDVTDFVRTKVRSALMASRLDDQAVEIEIANRRLREANETLEQRVAARTEAQRLTKEKLRASELRFRLMADSIPQIVWIVDDRGHGVYFNKQWAAYTGITLDPTDPAEVSAQFVHPDDHVVTIRAWDAARAGGGHFSVEHRIRSAAGEYRWFLVRAEAYRDPQSGRILMWFGTSTDVHDRKLAEAELGAREEQLRLATDAADVGEWDVDLASQTMYWPARVKAMFGISPDRPVTLADFYAGVHPEDRERTFASFEAAADPQLRLQYDAEYRTIGKEDGRVRWVAAKGRGLFNEEGKCVRVIGTAIDITGRKANDEALRESEERLRQADRRKDEFLAMLAHELRNPLAPISAAAELLQMGKLDEERMQRTSRIIGRQVRHMTGLVDDLLDVSRVTRGLVELEMLPVDLNHVIADAVEQVTPSIRARHHHLEMRLTPQATLVQGDKKRLVQVLANVLNNAAKYTHECGNIRVRTDVRDTSLLVEVLDDGIGMTPELVSRAFDLFAQAERSPDRSSGGLGLGLALVRSLVELHHGTVSCASPGPGQGSTFTICLPRLETQGSGHASDARTNDASDRQARGLHILVVDDNVDAAALLAMLLEASGHVVVVEHAARRALARAREEAFQVCLLDIGLPEMDGNELARQLRTCPSTAGSVLIAVTGYGQEKDREQTKAAGFDHHLVKPVDNHMLASILATVKPS